MNKRYFTICFQQVTPCAQGRFVFNKQDAGKEKTESEKQKTAEQTKTIDTVKSAAESKILAAEERLKKSGSTMSPEVKQRLHDFFATSVGRADKDNDGRISSAEVENFKKSMLGKVDDVVAEYAPTEAQIEARKKLQQSADKTAESSKP